MEFRVGQGIDVHGFTNGRALILGGVEIPYGRGLDGHSDADVLLHAIMDALLGAAGLGDIGMQFPNTDPQYKNISSLKLLESVSSLLKKGSWKIGNIDCSVLAEEPKISPHISKMKELICPTLQIDSAQLAIKATTTEKLGFVGRKEGITAFAVCLLQR